MSSKPRGAPGPAARDEGSAVVDFLLVSLLVTVLVLGVVQVALALHVKSVLTDAAGAGARRAALADSTLDAGTSRTRMLIDTTLPSSYAEHVSANYGDYGQLQVVEVHVEAPMPVLGMLGPSGVISVTGRALVEP